MAGTLRGDRLNTRVFLVAFQLYIRDGCNQVGNNMQRRYNRYCDGKEDIIYASSATPTPSLFLQTTQYLHSSKALFLLLFL